jgi:hypothetical protein
LVPGEVKRFFARVPPSLVPEVAQITRSLNRVTSAAEFTAEFGQDLEPSATKAICAAISRSRDFGEWPDLDSAGLYRREHASIAIRSGRTSVLFDPQGYHGSWSTGFARYPADRAPRVDAVVITHSHSDHWHLPSVLRHCDAHTTVIVPEVPRVNILTPFDFGRTLESAGQKYTRLSWFQKICVGGVDIQALPFFGEQPTRFAPGARMDLRNWGNCYSVKCEDVSILVLADSGADPMGEITDVVRELVAENGPFDIVTSCCASFPEGILDGLPVYALTLPLGRLREIHADRVRGRWKAITLGIDGIAEICAISRARYFLPYANGFDGLGREIVMDGILIQETELLARLAERLRSLGVSTSVVPWKVGDWFPLQTHVRKS